MKYIFLFLFLFLFVSTGFAGNEREHFRGGMMFHTGYLTNQLQGNEIKGICSGIGGKIVFPVMKHLRFGAEGYVSNHHYPESEGFYKLGWGGVLGEYQFRNKRFTPVAGVTVGGGKVRDLYPLAGNYSDNQVDEVIFKVYSTMIVAPHVSVEYKLTDHINLVSKVDYLFYPGIDYPDDVASGPRIYFGILFSR
ncbi:MAG TPA: hypothetical protein PKH79_04630 [Prolixibacteraceae bacterium]|nr:hypothetical protein [Prolixibacteraceae bacterium]HPS12398.1 hypothetical protein [Prolixibacteraceae bacterium]